MVTGRHAADISWFVRTSLTYNTIDPSFIFTTMSANYSFIHSYWISNKSYRDPEYNSNHSQTRASVTLNRLPSRDFVGDSLSPLQRQAPSVSPIFVCKHDQNLKLFSLISSIYGTLRPKLLSKSFPMHFVVV